MTTDGNSIIDLIQQHTTDRPNSMAVIAKDEEITYEELGKRIAGLSTLLVSRKVGPEVPVGVCVERSVKWICAMLGVLRSGGIYVPINPIAPAERTAQLIREMGIRVMLIDKHSPLKYSLSVDMETIDDLPSSAPACSSRPCVSSCQSAYAIATSGSTSTPKMVLASHANLWRYGMFLRREIGDDNDRYLQTASIDVSSSIRQVVAPLVAGATLVIASREEVFDPVRLALRMLDTRVTVFDTVPSYLSRWVPALWELPAATRHSLAVSLRAVFSTGEPLRADTVNALSVALPGVQVVNLYGQTETTGTVAVHRVVTPAVDPIPIGRVATDCGFYVLDETLTPSSEGELYISGPCLARYQHTGVEVGGQSFLVDATEPDGRIYRTGDRVRCLAGGALEFICRTDRRVKVHGIRFELDEIEAALERHPDVNEAGVVVKSAPDLDPRVVAFAAVRSGAMRCTELELRTFLKGCLPDVMIPSYIRIVSLLPRTHSGKIDYQALVCADISPALRPPTLPLSTVTEQLVGSCWEDVLDMRGIGPDDDFFALGGDSLQAIQMLILIQQRSGKTLPFSAMFFEEPTVRAFSEAIDRFTAGERARGYFDESV